jgi:dihydrofolate reductase
MSRIVTMMSISVDGYLEGPGGDLEWHLVDEELHRHFNELLAPTAAFLEGRVTYELMADYWPTADEDPTSPATVKEFARIWRDKPKVVFSRTLDHVAENVPILREVDPDEIAAMRAAADGDLYVGGAELVEAFAREDLIDEYRLYVHPVVLGRGTLLFRPSAEPRWLDLVELRSFGSGVVLQRYDVRHRDVGQDGAIAL